MAVSLLSSHRHAAHADSGDIGAIFVHFAQAGETPTVILSLTPKAGKDPGACQGLLQVVSVTFMPLELRG